MPFSSSHCEYVRTSYTSIYPGAQIFLLSPPPPRSRSSFVLTHIQFSTSTNSRFYSHGRSPLMHIRHESERVKNNNLNPEITGLEGIPIVLTQNRICFAFRVSIALAETFESLPQDYQSF